MFAGRQSWFLPSTDGTHGVSRGFSSIACASSTDLNYERAYKPDGRFLTEIELKTPERIAENSREIPERSTVGDSNTNFKRYL